MNLHIKIFSSLFHNNDYPIIETVDIPLIDKQLFLNMDIEVKLWFIKKTFKACIMLK